VCVGKSAGTASEAAGNAASSAAPLRRSEYPVLQWELQRRLVVHFGHLFAESARLL
jgi:hypothetical protein